MVTPAQEPHPVIGDAVRARKVETSDGVLIHSESTGLGYPILFVHEFSGNHASWEHQVRCFSRRYMCVTYSARGYPPSAVPVNGAQYSQARSVLDAVEVLDSWGIERAHIVGLSMGGFTALNLAIAHRARVSAVAIGGCGYGGKDVEEFRANTQRSAKLWIEEPVETGRAYGRGPFRIPFANKDPRGWLQFAAELEAHDGLGASLTVQGVQGQRPTFYDLAPQLAELDLPLLSVIGDEDDPCIETNLMLKRTVPTAALAMVPKTGHTVNLEEPAEFNRLLSEFFAWVESGRWPSRDPRSVRSSGGWSM